MHTGFLLLYCGRPHLGFLRSTKPREPPLFQQSRALDRQIQEQERIVKTLQKEQVGVKVRLTLSQPSWIPQGMVDSYKKNPSFADAKTKAKADGEYETVSLKVSE